MLEEVIDFLVSRGIAYEIDSESDSDILTVELDGEEFFAPTDNDQMLIDLMDDVSHHLEVEGPDGDGENFDY